MSTTPLRHDGVTIHCPVCQGSFVPIGRQTYCCDACRAAAYRRRRDAGRQPAAAVVVPKAQPRRQITVYECGGCGARSLGSQRCDGCGTFMSRVGIGGCGADCDEPVAANELVDQEVTRQD